MTAKRDMDMALDIVNNAKVSRPSVCNALDTVLVHAAQASSFPARACEALGKMPASRCAATRARSAC